ncbi:type VI secretion system baseplate subunit TssG [Telluria mixta]|uniref:Type VI secretion system baseplate subunit TssG n=1 Tax=Telluria mixta TaxID=34071 RepID=A0ABT2C3E0_9BURK|nr:type VI secretion system baseplate subunit TssG [Telluria mixta]MCS0631900.1 type VI secretion system baseplate subunit TssG [Telluria mixta]WEM95417.1 type VI secretion system baseplate subunit TssG [Telluria mixta]
MDLIARLLAEPQRFDFVQAVRLLLLALGERGIPESRALARHLRFANSLALGFPPSQVEAAALDADGYRLTPSFMGLLGAHGALPLHVTERLLALPQDEQDAQAARAFLDMFSTRMLALWYRAWQKYRVEHLVAGPRDGYLPLLLALAGVPAGGVFACAGVPDTALAAFAGLLRRRPVSAAVLGRVLSSHFGVAVRVQEGIGNWDPLDPGEQTVIGTNALLGRRALLGERSWRPDLRVRVRIGPLDRARYDHFLPGAAGARALRTLLQLFAVPTLAYDIVLVLRQADLRPVQLDASGRRLGLDSYLLSAPAAADRADLCYELRPLDPLPPLQSA